MKGMSKAWAVAAVLAAAVTMVGCVTGGGARPGGKEKRAVLMILWEGSSDLEVAVVDEAGVMLDMLQSAGYNVVVATKSGNPLVAKERTITPDLRITEARPADYAGLIMPCMNAGPSRYDDETAALIKAIGARSRPIAAQRGAVSLLANAGLLDGRNYSGAAPYFQARDASWVEDQVVVDGNIITSGGCPYSHELDGTSNATRELTEKFMAQLAE